MATRTIYFRAIGALISCWLAVAARAEDWLPIAPDELKMTAEPKAPAAPAVILYRQVDRDDNESVERIYVRIKILTDEGRKYADIQIPYKKGVDTVRGIQARTIRPDGSVVEFNGTIYDKPIIKSRGVKILVKTLTLPEVQAGSIIEYRYRHELRSGYVYDSHWMLSDELFTKFAKFSLVASRDFNMNFSWPVGLPPGSNPPKVERGVVRMETRDVPAFVEEDFMPPENELKYHVNFIYSESVGLEKDPIAFWKRVGKERYKAVESFVGKRRAMEEAVAQIVAPSDSPEIKLRKIYARTQQIRNLSFERAKTEQELEREKHKEAGSVADVWKNGYGDGTEVTWLFLGLVRAAGFEADPVLVSTRNEHFFNDKMMNANDLNSNLVVVKLNGNDVYLDPGVAFVPFGLLPWSETAVKGLRLDKNGGTWVTTPLPQPMDSRTVRKATLRLSNNGTLEGKVAVTYTGLEAQWRRLSAHNEDGAERKQFLENELKSDVPVGINVKVVNSPNWDNSEEPLVVEYDLEVPGWANGAGQRALMPMGVFGGGERNTFKHASRVHPLYFNFPSSSEDDIVVELPQGWQVQSLPPARNDDQKVVGYQSSAEDTKNGSLRIKRALSINLLMLDKKYYGALRDFFQRVRAGDEEQIVLGAIKAPAKR